MRIFNATFVSLSGLMVFLPPASADVLIAQASKRALVAKEIQSEAFKFANDLSNYNQYKKIEASTWNLIAISDDKASCAVSSAEFLDSLSILSYQYNTTIDSIRTFEDQGIDTSSMVATMENTLGVSKKKVAFNLEKMIQYCK